jgi:hypothetical protein
MRLRPFQGTLATQPAFDSGPSDLTRVFNSDSVEVGRIAIPRGDFIASCELHLTSQPFASQYRLTFGCVVNPHPEMMKSLSLINAIDAYWLTLYELNIGWAFVGICRQDWSPR